MNDDPRDLDTGEPVSELGDFAVDPSPELSGRVMRSINRHTLAADSLEFSLTILLQSFWEFCKGLVELFPRPNEEDGDGR